MTRVALTDEQAMLSATTAQLVTDYPTLADPGPDRSRAEAGLWDALVAAGLVGLVVAAERDGAEGATIDAALVTEQLARGAAAAPYLGTVLALDLLSAVAPEGPDTAELVAGRPGAVVVDRSLTVPAAVGIAVDAVPGALAIGVDACAVRAPVLGGRLDSVDPSRPLAATVGAGRVLGEVAEHTLARFEALALALVCADLVGTATGALDAAVAHARERQQFGRPIGSFQAVAHLCAEQLVTVESCRSITWQAAWAVDALEPAEAMTLCRVAKAHCSEGVVTVCEAAIQVFGGIGMTWECPAHRYLRRALLDRRLFGDERLHLAAIADERLGARPEPAERAR